MENLARIYLQVDVVAVDCRSFIFSCIIPLIVVTNFMCSLVIYSSETFIFFVAFVSTNQ